jgi:hypothetical protein
MSGFWSPEELQRIASADELLIAVEGTDGTLRRGVPVWVVCVDRHAFVRTWYQRETGWFGHVLRSGRARIRVPGVEAAVIVEHVGDGTPPLRSAVDAAYRAKYGRYGSSVGPMVAAAAVSTTLRLDPDRPAGPAGG